MKLQKDGRTLAKEDIYLDLSKLSEEKINHLKSITGYNIDNWDFFKYLIYDHTGWNQVGEIWLKNRREISYSDFVKLFQKELTRLPEKWYIRGSEETVKLIDDKSSYSYGSNTGNGYFIRGDRWYGENLNWFSDKYTEITVEDYKRLTQEATQVDCVNDLEGMPELSEEETKQLIIENYKYHLEKCGYFVFPKAVEGEFPDFREYESVRMEVCNNNFNWVRRSIYGKTPFGFLTAENAYTLCRPIQKPTPTVQELWKIAEEMKKALEEILIQINLSEIEEEFSFEIDKSKSALNKFNKLKDD